MAPPPRKRKAASGSGSESAGGGERGKTNSRSSSKKSNSGQSRRTAGGSAARSRSNTGNDDANEVDDAHAAAVLTKDSSNKAKVSTDKVSSIDNSSKLLCDLYNDLMPQTNPTLQRSALRRNPLTQLVTLVWPALEKAYNSDSNDKDTAGGSSSEQGTVTAPSVPTSLSFTQLCHLSAALLSLEYQDGSVTETTLHFVQQDQVHVFQAWCQQLFQAEPSDKPIEDTSMGGPATNDTLFTTVRIHCFDILWNCLAMQPISWWQVSMLHPILLSHVQGIVPDALPTRHRELYLQKLQKGPEPQSPSQPQVDKSFIVYVVQSVVLQRLESWSSSSSDTDDDPSPGLPTAATPSEWPLIHRALELLCDILSLATPTDVRYALQTYLDAIHWTVRCRFAITQIEQHLARLLKTGNAAQENARHYVQLTLQLLDRVTKWLQTFGTVHDSVTTATSTVARRSVYHARASIFQKFCLRYFADLLPDILYAGVGLLCVSPSTSNGSSKVGSSSSNNSSYLRQALSGLSTTDFAKLMHKMRLVDDTHEAAAATIAVPPDDRRPESYPLRSFLLDVLEDYLVVPPDPLDELQSFPLYPTEQLLWDFMRIPPSHSGLSVSPVLSLPKLSTRFVSFADYLWRNFELLRLESAYDIRSDIVDVIRRVRPVLRHQSNDDYTMQVDDVNETVVTEFTGWARMALELQGALEIKRVGKPLLGEKYPSQVVAEFSIDLKPCGDSIRTEWDALGEFDNMFLVAINAEKASGGPAPLLAELDNGHSKHATARGNSDNRRVSDEDDATFPERFGVTLVRGCMILQVRDEAGTILSDPTSEQQRPTGTKRIFRVALDPTQYSHDLTSSAGTDQYNQLNLVIRRHGKANNFRSVLETVRGLMAGMGSIGRVIPAWLQAALLGQGDPTDATFTSESMKAYSRATVGVANPDAFLDYGDTFLNEAHLRSSFAGFSDEIVVDGRRELVVADETERRCNYRVRVVENGDGKTKTSVEAKSYPFPKGANGNPVRFTELQVAAIRSGLSPGLTMVVGPPGTGKTDVVVQIIASLYHTFPTQRTIVITHSNAALNDIFEKVMARGDLQERYLVRLGSGERNLQTESTHDFTKIGRVAYSLVRRGQLLEQVQQLSESLGVSGRAERGADGSPSYTCETADLFHRHNIQKLIRAYHVEAKKQDGLSEETNVASFFPFSAFFKVQDSQLSHTEAMERFSQLAQIFAELAEYRPFELLRTQRQRSDYLIMKQARIVAMTCTHAAIARSHLIKLGFEYDNVIVEEAGQMLEIESFIPLLLQRGEAESSLASTGSCRLKRFCLIGDHNQLPPVIQNVSFAKFSGLDQSLFLRLIRLGVPHIQLDKQGRSRPEIASLYSWRYTNLGNLDHVLTAPAYAVANAGLAHVFQLINVDNFEGRGETSPTAYFFQNAGEAEYAVALFQYLVLIGHSPRNISILTTYNGQRELILDILAQRCGVGTPLAGVRPLSVSTVDQYQGQQNDIVLLSLVRTESIGHLRDVRRLIVAVSRARLGLYVLCRQELFESSHELKPTFEQLVRDKPNKLQLVVGENHPTQRKVGDVIPDDQLYEVDDVGHLGTIVYQMQENLVANSKTE